MKKPESHNTEYKQSWHDDHLKMLCAFANTGGGIMYVGMDDSGKPKGISNAKKLMEDIPSKVVTTLGFVPEVRLRKENGKEIISIKIKPHPSPVSLRGKFYVRSGSTTQELKGSQLQKFLLEKSGKSWESVIEDGATLKNIDEKTIERFKELSQKRFPIASKEKSVSGLLEKLGLLKKGKLTRAAILLFGNDPQRFFISSVIRIGRFKDDATLLSQDEINGNLFQQVEGAMEVLKKKYLHAEVTFEGLHRKEHLEYPEEALREAIVNAVVHRDYSDVHSQFRIYADQISLWNNGGLVGLTVAELKKKHKSYPRNELIADVFHKAGFIERWGTGTVKMIDECKSAGLPEPIYEESQGGMQVTFLKDIYTEEYFIKAGLNERQIKAMLYVKENGNISNKKYQSITNSIKRTATRDLAELLKKKLLKKIGITGKGTTYVQWGHKGDKGDIMGTRRGQDALDKKLSLLEKELKVINPDEEVKQQFDSELFIHIYNTWFSDLLKEIIPILQKFNRYFKKPEHRISISNNIGYIRFQDEKASDIIAKLREESLKKVKDVQSGFTKINIDATYRSFIKGGLKSFGCHYEIEIGFFDDWYEIHMVDEFGKGKKDLQYKRLYHRPLTKSEIKSLARKFGNVIYDHIATEVKQIKEKKS